MVDNSRTAASSSTTSESDHETLANLTLSRPLVPCRRQVSLPQEGPSMTISVRPRAWSQHRPPLRPPEASDRRGLPLAWPMDWLTGGQQRVPQHETL